MHPFHRPSRYIPSHKSCSNQRKERQGIDSKERDDSDDGSRRTSPSRMRLCRDEREHEEYHQVTVPLINVSQTESEARQPRKTNDILRAKEMALWSNTTPDWSDDEDRLGPNKNSIIEESLRSKK